MKNQDNKIRKLIDTCWLSYKNKVASGLFNPENEKMMQLQLAMTLQTVIPVFEFSKNESIKVLLEVPVLLLNNTKRIIDIVIQHHLDNQVSYFPVELKCYRLLTREGTGKKRGAQNIGMYDYWADIQNIESYNLLDNFSISTHLMLTDDSYYVTAKHIGPQVSVYSTCQIRENVTGNLSQSIANRPGKIELMGTYSMKNWEKLGSFYFIRQESNLRP
jgi:hypothetical protein